MVLIQPLQLRRFPTKEALLSEGVYATTELSMTRNEQIPPKFVNNSVCGYRISSIKRRPQLVSAFNNMRVVCALMQCQRYMVSYMVYAYVSKNYDDVMILLACERLWHADCNKIIHLTTTVEMT